MMPLTIAAIRVGTDPVGKLPEASFHRWLETQLLCPKCDATYNLVCDYNAATGRHFAEESRRLILMLKKAIAMSHGNDHRISHFETSGVVVTSFANAAVAAEEPRISAFPPLPRHPTIH